MREHRDESVWPNFAPTRMHMGPWEKTPWWHWRRLAGHAMRRPNYTRGGCQYATHAQCARLILEEEYG